MKKIFYALLTLAIIVLGFFAFNSYIYNKKQAGNNTQQEPQRMSLSGEYVCLPHRDTKGPQTLECAFGLKADNGFYYALDFGLMSQTVPELHVGERISAAGVFTPIEYLSTDYWRKYDVVGIFSVTDSLKKL